MVILCICVHSDLLAQKTTAVQKNITYEIYLEDYRYTFLPNEKCNDTLIDTLGNGHIIKLNLFNCMGQIDLECYYKNSLLEKGAYCASLGMLKKYSYFKMYIPDKYPGHVKSFFKIISFYQPLRDGIWCFYNDGRLYMKKNYDKGILVDSIMIK